MRFFVITILSLSSLNLNAWGFYGHKKINEIAIYTLPKPLFAFYKLNAKYITEHAVDADKRRYIVEDEACRHYLDGDFYEYAAPIDTIPQFYKDAILKYGEDTVKAHGIVPWHIQTMMFRLTEAFKNKDYPKILKLSADLGHYIGDCHVPLHATSNYNGQKTNQVGIHSLWESRLPELFNNEYDLFTGLAVYSDHPVKATWQAYSQSFALVDTVLSTEKTVSLKFTESKKYSFEKKGSNTIKVYSKEFSEAYQLALGSMVEDRMRASIVLLGSFWYTCWVNAGQPELSQTTEITLPKEHEEVLDNKKKAQKTKGHED
ncbi:MAG: zinc dependent phospholipase C family protein [bacterium]|nr:zinc dependent phospholipase C family protein [bacterium]